MSYGYVHGHDPLEQQRLADQAGALVDILHGDTFYPAGSRVLEAGCGTGAQTVTLARRSPGASFVSVDRSATALEAARAAVAHAGLDNVELQQADLLDPPFAPASFDHLFVCFVLEHLPQPVDALTRLRTLLTPGGTLTLIEGDHGSTFFHPDSNDAHDAIDCLVSLQAAAGGNALIGRQIYPLMIQAGFSNVRATQRTVYVDASLPDLVDAFTEKTFIAMVAGTREAAIGAGLTTAERFDRGIHDLRRTKQPDGVFCYSFFKGTGMRSREH